MFGDVAPAVSITDIPGGDAGVFATLAKMAELARRAAGTLGVRALAVVWTFDARTPVARAQRLRAELAEAYRYRDDLEAETIYDPQYLAREYYLHGTVTGDCDDLATLGAALALSIGLPVWFVVVNGEDPETFGHVYAEIRPPGVNPGGACTFDAAATGAVELDLQRPPGPVVVTRIACVKV